MIENGSGAVALTINGVAGGIETLTNANTYTGATTITLGSLDLSNALAVQNSPVVLNGGSLIFDQSVSGNAFTIGGLSGSAALALQNNASTPAPVALTVGGAGTSGTYSGFLTGAGSLTKVGTGTLTLSGNDIYTGATSISAGTLSISGTMAGTSSVVTSGAGAFTGKLHRRAHRQRSRIYPGRHWLLEPCQPEYLHRRDDGDRGLALSRRHAQRHPLRYHQRLGCLYGNLDRFDHRQWCHLHPGQHRHLDPRRSEYLHRRHLHQRRRAEANAADGSGYGALGNGGNITFGGGTLQYGGGAAGTDYSSRIVSSASAIQVDTAGNAITYNQSLASSNIGGLTVLDSVNGGFSNGSLTLNAVNAYLGSTTVEGGGYLFNGNASGALPTGTTLVIGGTVNTISGGTFDLDGNNQTVAGLISVGNGSGDIVTNNNGSYATLTVNGTGGTFAGQINDGNNGTAFTLAAGTETLSGNNTYSGNTTVTGGTLIVSGSLSGDSPQTAYGNVNVNGGTLAGTGLIVAGNTSVTTGSGATLAPGLSANGLSINAAASTTGALSLQAGSTFQLSINNSNVGTSGSAALTDYSKLTLGSNVSATLAGAISTTLGTAVNTGDLFTVIIMNGSPVSGTFSNTTLVAGQTSIYSFTSGGALWYIDYAYNPNTLGLTDSGVSLSTFEADTNGDDVALLASVPEPGTWAMMLAGMGMLMVLQRRRRI